MILVFIILGIIIFVTLSMLIFKLSNVKLEIKRLHISNIGDKFKVDFVLNIGLYLFDKLKLINFTIDNLKISDLLKTGKIKLNHLKDNKGANKDITEILKSNEFEIEYFKLEGYFATFNPVLSSVIFAVINAAVPILIAPKTSGSYINNLEFLNINDNKININLNCIIKLKMVNIINILHYLKKKGGRNNGKSSYRRSYAYCNE